MSDEISSTYLSSAEQIAANYKKYGDMYKDDSDNMVNVDTFLNLLVAEMTNQDPLEPTSNTEFISQMATFSSLQSMENASYYSNATYASSLVGKTVTVASYTGADYKTETGVVQSIELSGKTFSIKVNGNSYKLSAIQSVQPEGTTESSSSSSSLSADSTYAATLVGMYVTVQANDTNGQTVVDEGIAESFEVKDGKVGIIIDGVSYNLSDIVKVRYASDSDVTEPTEPTESAEPTEPTDSAETTILAADNTDSASRADIEDIVDIEDVEDVEDAELDTSAYVESLIEGIRDESDINEVFEQLLELVKNGEI